MAVITQQQLERSLDVLEVAASESWDDVQARYRKLVQHWHPDRYSGQKRQDAQSKFIEFNNAFKVLRDHYRKKGSLPTRQNFTAKDTRSNKSSAPNRSPARSKVRTGNGPRGSQHVIKTPIHKEIWFRNAAVGAGVFVVLAGILWKLDTTLNESMREKSIYLRTGTGIESAQGDAQGKNNTTDTTDFAEQENRSRSATLDVE